MKIIGYIITTDEPGGRRGQYFAAPPLMGKKTILWFGGAVTLFSSRDRARQCIARTKTWARKHDLNW